MVSYAVVVAAFAAIAAMLDREKGAEWGGLCGGSVCSSRCC